MTLAATWVIGEYCEILVAGGIVDEEQPKQVSDTQIVDLLITVLHSSYANQLVRQFVVAALSKIASRQMTTQAQQSRISQLFVGYTTSPELELQQRAVEFESLFHLGAVRTGVLERMPTPPLRATVMGGGMSP